jgi:hypothetical protein|nr:MAG TPA: hypothetical protein [Caudoviricetes sp.]
MSLIDADELKKELYQQWFMDILLTQRNSEDMFYALAQKIDEQPTAYDVDKVVEQLNDNFRVVRTDEDLEWNRAMDDAITIVKGGGADGN